MVVVLAAAGATVSVVLALASNAGWPQVVRQLQAGHAWAWLAVCLVGELLAYGGYVLTVRAVARVDDGNAVGLRASIAEVVAGFGVFAATRTSGGFAADYWAFCEAGANRREAVRRVLALSFLEYSVLSVSALVASALLFFGLDLLPTHLRGDLAARRSVSYGRVETMGRAHWQPRPTDLRAVA